MTSVSALTRGALLTVLAAVPLAAQTSRTTPSVPPEARRVHDAAIVLDTHFDTPANLGRTGWSIMDRHSRADSGDQVDYPRMVEGGIDGGFFAIFTAQGPRTPEGDRDARDAALVRAVQIREMVARHPDAFRLVTTSAEAR
jgi:membrane dipeptidase